MVFQPSRRTMLAMTGGTTISAALALLESKSSVDTTASLVPKSRGPRPHQNLTATLVAESAATRSDRRSMAGGVHDPVSNQTFITWIGDYSHPYVAAYNHATGEWSDGYRVGTSPFPDSHNYPTIVQADDGTLLVFHGAHNSTQRVARSTPHDASGHWTDEEIPAAQYATYPMPVKSENGYIYLFYRETSQHVEEEKETDDRPIIYLVSKDHGQSWQRGAPSHRWAIGSTGRHDNMNEVYIGQIRRTRAQRNVPEQFHFVWTIAGGGPGIHEHDRYHRNLYYATFHPSDGHFYNAAGEDLGEAIDGPTMEERTKAIHTELERAKPQSRDVGYTHIVGHFRDRPVLLFNTQDGDVKVINSAYWNGREWEMHELVRDMGLLDLEPINPAISRVYMVPRDEPVGVQTYLLRAGGRVWTPEQRVQTSAPISRASLIPDSHPEVRLVLTEGSREAELPDADVSVISAK